MPKTLVLIEMEVPGVDAHGTLIRLMDAGRLASSRFTVWEPDSPESTCPGPIGNWKHRFSFSPSEIPRTTAETAGVDLAALDADVASLPWADRDVQEKNIRLAFMVLAKHVNRALTVLKESR